MNIITQIQNAGISISIRSISHKRSGLYMSTSIKETTSYSSDEKVTQLMQILFEMVIDDWTKITNCPKDNEAGPIYIGKGLGNQNATPKYTNEPIHRNLTPFGYQWKTQNFQKNVTKNTHETGGPFPWLNIEAMK